LVALIRNYDETYNADSSLVDVNLTLVIVTPSEPTKLSEDREADNYVPILRPIYAELMEVIMDSSYFRGYYQKYPTHKRIESFHLGSDTPQGNKAYLLPDCVDGIIIEDMKLTLSEQSCSATVVGPETEVIYLNNVSELNIALNGSSAFTVTFTSAQYTDTEGVGFGEAPEYTIYTSHNEQTYPILVGGTRQYGSFTNDTDTTFTGYISCDDGVRESKLYFYYRIINRTVRGASLQSKFVLQDFTLGGTEYDNYPFNVVTRHSTQFSTHIHSQSVNIDGGNEMWAKTYQPVSSDTTSHTTAVNQPLSATYRDVTNVLVVGENTAFDNISYYKQV
jgi:hypothetical protein